MRNPCISEDLNFKQFPGDAPGTPLHINAFRSPYLELFSLNPVSTPVIMFYVCFYKGNGVVDFGEFVNMMINQNNNTLDEKELLEAFRTFDGDDKGYIFSNEIRYVMRHMGESIPEQDINEILQDQEESRKRKITFEGTNGEEQR